jgi:hypothetical protein
MQVAFAKYASISFFAFCFLCKKRSFSYERMRFLHRNRMVELKSARILIQPVDKLSVNINDILKNLLSISLPLCRWTFFRKYATIAL